MTGFEIAKRIRQHDSNVPLVFITKLENLSIKGYEVDAVDFVVKPIDYFRFSILMKKLLKRVVQHEEKWINIRIHNEYKNKKIDINKITYVEINDHIAIIHSEDGNFSTWSSLSLLEKEIASDNFARCNSCYLVNLKFVKSVGKNEVEMPDAVISISRGKKREFTE